LIPFQIHESLSLQTALESSPNCFSSPRALGSRSSWWIVFVTPWTLLLANKSIACELANSCGSLGRFVITSIS
jgi:hypothetical protein